MTYDPPKGAENSLTAAVYIRVSTVAQSGPDRSSLDRQLDECLGLAGRQGYEVPDDLQFRDVMSGQREDRPAFQSMMEAAKRGEFSRLFVWSIDRLGRSFRLSVNTVYDLKELGVSVETLKEGDLGDTVRLGVLAAISAREIERLQERTLPARKAKRDAGFFVDGRAPFGYRRRDDGSLEKCPVEAPTVRRIFRDCTMGLGGRQISIRLNQDHILPPEIRVRMPDGRIRRVRPGHMEVDEGVGSFAKWLEAEGGTIDGFPEWSNTSVNRILNNPAAMGCLDTSGPAEIRLLIRDGAIITKSEFEAAQAAKGGRLQAGRRPPTPWLLTGLLVCGCCGGKYVHGTSNHSTWHYYKCTQRASGKSCPSRAVAMTTADRQVVREVREFLRERLGGTDGIRGHVLSEALRDREEVERQISAMEAELASADGRWLEVQSLVTKLVQAGADMTALPMVLADVAAARDARQAIAGVLSAAMDRRQMIDAGLRSSSAEIDAVVERITLGLELVEGPERQPEHVADALFVLRALVEKVVVSPERDLTVFLRQDAASLFRVFADILKTAVEGHRLDRGLGLVIQDSKP